MRKFKIGDKVKLRKDSRWYDSQIELSEGTYGVICQNFNYKYEYSVQWKNEERAYDLIDLEPWGHPINDLNKLLYPDYVEQDGLLVPKEKI
jgi:hypothetical protein